MAEPHVSADCPVCGSELSTERECRGLCPSCLVGLAIDVPKFASDASETKEVEFSSSYGRNGSS
mgnify:CR=1 FL=1